MFDDLRNDAVNQFEEEAQSGFQSDADTSYTPTTRGRSKKFLGLSSLQRFVLVFLLMLATCLIGSLCLFATGKIALF
ncbi:hypothetical protein MASR2M66_23280 [Chloroflexota bacterium]